jgi:hypothetical protein
MKLIQLSLPIMVEFCCKRCLKPYNIRAFEVMKKILRALVLFWRMAGLNFSALGILAAGEMHTL